MNIAASTVDESRSARYVFNPPLEGRDTEGRPTTGGSRNRAEKLDEITMILEKYLER